MKINNLRNLSGTAWNMNRQCGGNMYNDKGNTKYLKLLKQNYSSSQDVIKEIVNLSAIINLPKGTEFFLSDIHGEYEAFLHIMNNCSGVIKEKVDLIFKDTISDYDR